MQDLKSSLRKQSLARRASLTPQFMREAAEAVAQHLLSLMPSEPCIVAGYAAIRGELDVFPALKLLEEKGHALCLPDIEHKETPLIFKRWRFGEPLVAGSYGIPTAPQGEAVIPDMVLVPLAAFDASLHRLGYGAGYYDRTIHALRARKKTVRIIGGAYSMQQTESIHPEPHDEVLDAVVTERGVMGRL